MAELQWVAGKVGSWFTAANWSPAKVPTAADDEVIDGASSLAEIDDATGLADNVTVGAGAELEVGTGGVLDATNAITVDGFAAELLVENGGEVESANSSVLNIGGATPNSSASGELVLAGTGATIKPATVVLNGGSSSLDFEMTDSFTFANAITGLGDVVQVGPATVTLTGDDTYSGGTFIEAGTLQIGDGGKTASLGAGKVINDGTLAFDLTGTIANAVSGSGAVSLSGGNNICFLTGANSYSGATTISNLNLLVVGDDTTAGTLGTGEVVDNGGLGFARSDAVTVANNISGSGGVVQFLGALTLTGDNTYTGATDVHSGVLIAGSQEALGTNSAVTVEGGATLDLNGFSSVIGALSGAGTVDNSAAANAGLVVDENVDSTFSGVIENTGGLFGLGLAGSGTLTLTGANTYGGATGIEAGGTLQIGNGGTTGTLGSGQVFDSGSLVFDRSQGEAISQDISDGGSGPGSLTIEGGGVISLLGANSYSGVTTINSGSLFVGDDTTTGTLGTGAVVDNGALEFARSDSGNIVANSISGTGEVFEFLGRTRLTGNNSYTGETFIASGELVIGNGGTTGTLGTGAVVDNGSLAFARNGPTTVANAISGTGSVTAIIGGTILTGDNTYSGGTHVDSLAALEVKNTSTTSAAGVLGGGNIVLDPASALVFDNDDLVDNGYVVDNAISGSGAVEFVGHSDSVTTLNAANSFTGGAFISNGIVDLSNNAALGAGLVTMTGGAIRADHGAKTLSNNFTVSGFLGLGAGTNITGAITLAGNTTVTPAENAGESTWSGAVSLGAHTLATGNVGPNSDGGSWSGQALTISGAISGTGGVTQASSGALVLSGANTYSGPTTVTSGTLEVLNGSTTSAVGVLGRGAVGVSAGAALLFDNADEVNIGYLVRDAISGGGAVNFVGPNDGITTLTAANSFTGGANISSGIVNLTNNAALGAGAVIMTGGAIRAVSGARSLANKFTLSGTIGLGAATNITGAITLAANTTVTPSENAGASTWSGPVALGAFTLATGNVGPNTDGGSWSGQALTISGAISGTAGVTQASSGTLVLSGFNTYSGPTIIKAGKLEVLNASTKSAAGVLGRGAVAVSAGAALLFDNADKADNGYVVDNVISGAGAVDFVGPNDAVTTLNEANRFTGGAKISSGIVDLSNNASLGSGLVTMTGGAIRAVHGAKTLANKFTLSGTIGLGSATNITGAITLAGNTTVTPSVNAGDSTLSGAISLGAFTLATGDSGPNSDGGSWAGQGLTISGAISGTGGVSQESAGELDLTGQNSYSGATTIGEGALAIGSAQALGTGGLVFAGSGALDADFSGTLTTATTVKAGIAASITAGAGDSFNLTGALTQAAGSTLALGAGVTLTLTGGSTVSGLTVAGNAIVTNNGTAIQSGGSVTLGDAVATDEGELVNAGTWDITDDSGIAVGADPASFIDNAGVILKSGGTGTSTVAPAFTNTGQVIAESGTFDFESAVTGSGTDVIAGASTLEFDAAVASQTIAFSGAGGVLDLGTPQDFAAAIAGFNEGAPEGTNDAIRLLGNWSETGFLEIGGITTLTLSNGAASAPLIFAGIYQESQFTFSQSGGVTTIT